MIPLCYVVEQIEFKFKFFTFLDIHQTFMEHNLKIDVNETTRSLFDYFNTLKRYQILPISTSIQNGDVNEKESVWTLE